MLLAFAGWRKEGSDPLFIVYDTSFLVSFFSFLLIPLIGCKFPSPLMILWAVEGVFGIKASLE